MKITRVETTTHSIPVNIPLLKSDLNRTIVFARVETDEGSTDYGLTGGIQRYRVREFINRELARS